MQSCTCLPGIKSHSIQWGCLLMMGLSMGLHGIIRGWLQRKRLIRDACLWGKPTGSGREGICADAWKNGRVRWDLQLGTTRISSFQVIDILIFLGNPSTLPYFWYDSELKAVQKTELEKHTHQSCYSCLHLLASDPWNSDLKLTWTWRQKLDVAPWNYKKSSPTKGAPLHPPHIEKFNLISWCVCISSGIALSCSCVVGV